MNRGAFGFLDMEGSAIHILVEGQDPPTFRFRHKLVTFASLVPTFAMGTNYVFKHVVWHCWCLIDLFLRAVSPFCLLPAPINSLPLFEDAMLNIKRMPNCAGILLCTNQGWTFFNYIPDPDCGSVWMGIDPFGHSYPLPSIDTPWSNNDWDFARHLFSLSNELAHFVIDAPAGIHFPSHLGRNPLIPDFSPITNQDQTEFTLVKNISSYSITDTEQLLLEQGLTFAPLANIPLMSGYIDLAKNARTCRLKEHFSKHPAPKVSLPHGCWQSVSTWNPGNSNNVKLENYLNTLDTLVMGPIEKEDFDNQGRYQFSDDQRILRSLANHDNLIFKKADKSSQIVIMDKDSYIQEALSPRHLGNKKAFRSLGDDHDNLLEGLIAKVEKFVKRLTKQFGPGLPVKFLPNLITSKPRLGFFYLLPKTHKASKPDLPLQYPCRGICSMSSHPREGISKWIHELLKPILSTKYLPEYIQDTMHFLQIIEGIRDNSYQKRDSTGPISIESKFFTIDVVSMFTTIPIDKGMDACAAAWSVLKSTRFPSHPVEPDHIKWMTKFLLENALVSFGDMTYKSLNGTPIGHRHSVVLANAFMSACISAFWKEFPNHSFQTPIFLRMLDDCFGLWNGTKSSFDTFLIDFNQWLIEYDWGIQFELSCFGDPCQFLDVEIYRNIYGIIHTRLYYKSSDVHAFVSATSHHPRAMLKNIPVSVALRIKRICSEEHEFEKAWNEFVTVFFPRRGYPEQWISRGSAAIKHKPRSELLERRGDLLKDDKVIPFIFPYAKKHFFPLHKSGLALMATHNVNFMRLPQSLAPRITTNISKILFSSALRTHNSDPPPRGSAPCNSASCPICRYINTSDKIVSMFSGRTFYIRRNINCTDKHVVYVVNCHKCKLQGVGETVDPRKRLTSYINTITHAKSEESIDCAIQKHFASDHNPDDISFHLIEKMDFFISENIAHAVKLRYEQIWIDKLNAKLNVRKQLHLSMSGGFSSRKKPKLTEQISTSSDSLQLWDRDSQP